MSFVDATLFLLATVNVDDLALEVWNSLATFWFSVLAGNSSDCSSSLSVSASAFSIAIGLGTNKFGSGENDSLANRALVLASESLDLVVSSRVITTSDLGATASRLFGVALLEVLKKTLDSSNKCTGHKALDELATTFLITSSIVLTNSDHSAMFLWY